MISREEAVKVARQLIESNMGPYDPPLRIDYERVRERRGLLVVPYNSIEYLETRDLDKQLVGLWPIIVDLSTGQARQGSVDDRPLFKD
ncbi:YrhB domain-containing protein [Streptomyces sp. NPDC018019]|uniref:YrhB domain-containing protein n=1 Tax=Streptomyces sp. NPDC018019 TaxID=3365030 RepID=UPI00378EC104